MLKTASPPAPPRVASVGFARFAWAVLAYNVGVVLWGAYVRATGSGAGCGKNWPLCNGEVIPHSPGTARLIEFSHRATSGIDLALVALLVVWAFRAFPRRHPVRAGAVLSAVFLMTEALIGAALVLLEHVAQNASATRAYSLSTHLINTLTLLAFLTLTAWWAMGKPLVRPAPLWTAIVSVVAVVLTGVTGAIAALGDTLFPVRSLAEGLAQDFDPGANIFVRLRWLHPLVAAAAGAWLLYYALRKPQGRALAALVCAQLTAGAANLLLRAPVAMQLVHLLIADLVWISLVLLCATPDRASPIPNPF
jgi:heme A synthase